MTEPNELSDPKSDLPELDELELEPEATDGDGVTASDETTTPDGTDGDLPMLEELTPAAEVVAESADAPAADAQPAATGDPGAEGQWVWQYAAPAPPPSFGAVFFSGSAKPELYRFFACGLLVVIGCFLPWGPATHQVANPEFVNDPEVAPMVTELMALPDVLGVHTTLGVVSLAIGLYLMFSALGSIYTRRPRILPVFLMLEPAFVSWTRFLDARAQAGDLSLLESLDAAGSGLLLVLFGSTLVSAQFLLTVGKVYGKKDDKGAARRGKADGKSKKGDAKSKKDDAKGKDAKGKSDKDGDGKGDDDKGGKGRRGKRR